MIRIALKNFQIFLTVVLLISISMMNNLLFAKISANDFFSHNPVLPDISVNICGRMFGAENKPVSVFQYKWLPLVGPATLHGAKSRTATPPGPYFDGLIATGAESFPGREFRCQAPMCHTAEVARSNHDLAWRSINAPSASSATHIRDERGFSSGSDLLEFVYGLHGRNFPLAGVGVASASAKNPLELEAARGKIDFAVALVATPNHRSINDLNLFDYQYKWNKFDI